MLMGVMVLLGWLADIAVLKSILPHGATMKVNTALCFLLAGGALWLCREEGATEWRRRACQAGAALVTMIALLTLGEYVSGRSFGIDQWLVRQPSVAARPEAPGRMSTMTAVSFLLLGTALLTLDWRRTNRWRPSAGLALAAALIGLLGFTGYIFGVRSHYALLPFYTMAIHTALGVFLLAAGILCARSGPGPLEVLTGGDGGGRLARRLLPYAVGVPLTVGWLLFQGERLGYYGHDLEMAIYATTNVLIFSVLIWRTALWLDRSDAALRAAAQDNLDLKSALDQHTIVAITDPRGKITHVNDKFCAISKYAREELLGRDHRIINSGYHSKEFITGLWRTISAGQIWRGEMKNRAKDGTFYWVDTTIVPFLDGEGRPHHYVAARADITELKRTHEELARINEELEQRVRERTADLSRSRDELQAAQRISHVGSWAFDLANGRVEWSPEMFRITGLDPATEAPAFEHQAKLFTPESWAKLQETVSHTAAAGAGYELQLEVIRPDGDRRWTVARAEATRSPGGALVRLSGTLQDLTELKRAQTELERATERMQLAVRAGALGVWDWRLDANELVWDETMYRLYRIEPDAFSLTYEAWRSAVHPDDRAATDAALQAAVAEGTDFDRPFRIVRPDGQVRHLQPAALVHRDADGRARRVVGIIADITERRQAELALQFSERLLRDFVRHAPAAIAMLDREMRYLEVSERWLADYRLTGQDLVGRHHYEVFPDLPERLKEVHQRVLSGQVERCDEDPFLRADGGMEWLQWEARPWWGPDGAVGGLIFFTQDITARKRMELQLRGHSEQLARSNRDLEQFAYVASHDLQEPLRAVAGCAQILQGRYAGKLEGTGDELIRHIVEGAGRMQALIHDLLAYSRVGTQEARFAPTESAEALERALANLGTAAQEAGAKVTSGPLPPVPADPGQLAQLFQNLVGNALKYRGPNPPEIRVEASRGDRSWTFTVRDNGLGIEPRYFERIFVIFQRLHTREEFPGTGIGLALCKKIVERHGGRIWVESEPGRGSAFHFSIPDSP